MLVQGTVEQQQEDDVIEMKARTIDTTARLVLVFFESMRLWRNRQLARTRAHRATSLNVIRAKRLEKN